MPRPSTRNALETPRAPELHPAFLPRGTVVGSWRVLAWAGRGVHGAVYRVVPVEQEQARPLALKLALLPRNPRFTREAQLLSRLHHPHVPRLWTHGEWQHPSGPLHPFLVMEFVEGAPLYDWAWYHTPSSQQVLRLLAQIARALQALHAQEGVHRDVKGDNILVGHTDGLARLTDFGAGTYPEAASLTPEMLPPSTPAYRAPEAWLFARQFLHDRTEHYRAGPADDLYALGVTAYRLVTGKYPELAEPFRDEAGLWHLKGLSSPAPLVLNPRVAPPLNELILRMLSTSPEQRGTTQELAEALEQASELTTPESTRPLFTHQAPPSVRPEKKATDSAEVQRAEVPLATSPTQARRWRARLVAAAALLTLGAWVGWVARDKSPELPSGASRPASPVRPEDAGTAMLGEAAVADSPVTRAPPSASAALAEDTLPEPLPGQARPDAKGRCPRKRQVSLNGSCWVPFKGERDQCEDANGQWFKGQCYVPIFVPGRQPTSHPVHEP